MMRAVRISLMIVLIAAGSGCVSKSKARLQAQNAYLQGQNQGLRQAQQSQSMQAKFVIVNGPVKNHQVPWEPELKLSKAIFLAEFTGRGNPKGISLTRNGETAFIAPVRLLQGLDDVELEAGDVVEIKP